jgi:hypothetical protein
VAASLHGAVAGTYKREDRELGKPGIRTARQHPNMRWMGIDLMGEDCIPIDWVIRPDRQ